MILRRYCLDERFDCIITSGPTAAPLGRAVIRERSTDDLIQPPTSSRKTQHRNFPLKLTQRIELLTSSIFYIEIFLISSVVAVVVEVGGWIRSSVERSRITARPSGTLL
jgi:hypothetical protein